MRLLLFALAVSLGFATSAAAGGSDLCLVDSGTDTAFVLKRVRLPKGPGDVTPVAGYGLTATSSNNLPLSGTLVREPGGGLLLGLTRYFQRCLIGIVLDETFSGTVSYDCNLDNANDTVSSVTLVDCATVVP